MQSQRLTALSSPHGISLATPRLFAKHGARVAILDLDGDAAAAAAAAAASEKTMFQARLGMQYCFQCLESTHKPGEPELFNNKKTVA